MKKTMFTLLLGIFIGALIFGTAASFAYESNIFVEFLPLKYYFNGQQKYPPEDQQGFIYNGRTYVPLRFMAESLGQPVDWDGNTYSIYVGQNTAQDAYQTTSETGIGGMGITLTPASGSPGTTIEIIGSGFADSSSGYVWFDTNNNEVRDYGENEVYVSTTPKGLLTTSIRVPESAKPGTYRVLVDIPSGELIDASSEYKVVESDGITLSPSSGSPGTTIDIRGTGFADNYSGYVWFDTNNNEVRDYGENEIYVTTNSKGLLTTSIRVPEGAEPGTYRVLVDIPSGELIDASREFKVVESDGITLTPSSGSPGATIDVRGSGFADNYSGYVWFDINDNEVRDYGENEVYVSTNSDGLLTTSIRVPEGVKTGTYRVLVDIPSGNLIDASSEFTVR